MKIVYFGTPLFAADTLRYLLANGVEIAAVVTQPPRPKGRSKRLIATPVAEVAREHLLTLHEPQKPVDISDQLACYHADLFVVVAYGEFMPKVLREMPRLACINVHPSLLPKYRGAAPIQRAILNGETETGVSIMHLAREMDAGDLIRVGKFPIKSDETAGELSPRLCELGSHLLLQAIHELDHGGAERTPQDHSQATEAPKIDPADCQIDWSRPAHEIHNLIRATSPKPGAWCHLKMADSVKRLKILRSTISDQGEWVVPCGNQSLSLLELQLEGKRPMEAGELLRGLPKGEFELC